MPKSKRKIENAKQARKAGIRDRQTVFGHNQSKKLSFSVARA